MLLAQLLGTECRCNNCYLPPSSLSLSLALSWKPQGSSKNTVSGTEDVMLFQAESLLSAKGWFYSVMVALGTQWDSEDSLVGLSPGTSR